eukprot:s2472_g1.t1
MNLLIQRLRPLRPVRLLVLLALFPGLRGDDDDHVWLWRDVGFGLTHTMSSVPLVVSDIETGCTIQTLGIELTCKDRNLGSVVNFCGQRCSVHGYSSMVILSISYEPRQKDWWNWDYAIQCFSDGADSCGKLTYTHHFAAEDSVSTWGEWIVITPGQVVNLTCVLLPFPAANSVNKRAAADKFTTSIDVKLAFGAHHIDNGTNLA